MTRIRRQLGRLGGERGFTLIELMMAAMVAAVGVGAVTTILIGARQLTADSERGTTQAHIAQRSMEEALAVPYERLAMREAPGNSTNANDPRFYVASAGTAGAFTYKWDQSTPSSASREPVLIDTVDGDVRAVTTWTDGRLQGTIYRFVTGVDEPAITNSTARPLPDAKRVVVAVTVTGGDRPRKPVYLTSVVAP